MNLKDRGLQRVQQAQAHYDDRMAQEDDRQTLLPPPSFAQGFNTSTGKVKVQTIGKGNAEGVAITNGGIAIGDRVSVKGGFVDAMPRVEIPTVKIVPQAFLYLDLYLLVDISGSFGDDLPVLRQIMETLFKQIRARLPDINAGALRVGLGTFAGFDLPGDLTHRQNLTPKVQDIRDALSSLEVGGAEEKILTSLYEVAQGADAFGFSKRGKRVVVVLTDEVDETPHVDIPTLAAQLKAAKITPIFTVAEGLNDGTVVPYYQSVVDGLGVGTVELLEADSRNLVTAIKNALTRI
jgi:hypothetical protein